MKNIISRFCDFYLKYYKQSAVFLLIVFLIFGYLASKLKINSNQLDLLPQGLPEVIEAKKITEMVGGTGYFIITIKNQEEIEGDKLTDKAVYAKIEGHDKLSDELFKKAQSSYSEKQDKIKADANKLKEVSDILYNELTTLPTVRFIQYKIDLDFIKKKFLYFWKTEDLKEAFRRIGIKRDELIRKSDPFYIQLVEQDYNLELTDLVNKYNKIGKKEIIDDYYVSPDRRMMIMLVRPKFSMNDIEKSRAFLNKVNEIVNKMGLEKKGVKIGYTGTYVQYVDAYDSINNSLKPTLALSLIGITLILYIFIRRKRLIIALLISLIFSIVVTFGLTYLIIGQLNIITATFGGILAGFGIDFGLHYIFRFREEFWESGDIYEAIKSAIFHTGKAAISSASTTAAAFIVLISSSFKGFSEFGIISAYGIIITALSMFFVTSLQLIFLYKYSDKFKEYLSQAPEEKDEEAFYRKINYQKLSRNIVIVTILLFVASLFFTPQVEFDPDSRHMLEKDVSSEVLKSEMHLRYDIAGDPLAIATKTIDETASLYEFFDPMTQEMKESVGQIMSIFSFVPAREKQLLNYNLIEDFKKKNQIVKYSLVPDNFKSYWQQYQTIINQKPFSYQDLPPFLTDQFINVPESNVKGYMTFIYPNVDKLFFTYDIDKLYNLVHEIHYPVIGKRTIRTFVDYIPQWEQLKSKKIPGSTAMVDYWGMHISEKDKNGVLDIINHIAENELKQFNFFPLVNNEILKSRPFLKFEDIQKTTLLAKTTGSIIILSKFTHIVKNESQWIIIGTSILVIIILLFSFKNLKSSAIALIPLLTGMIIILGVMVISGVKINYFNVVIFPIIIGYGINNGIFIYHRFLENNSISKTLSQTGSAVIASSLTTLAGWGTLLIALHPGLKSMGMVAVIGLTIMLIISITFLPAVIYLVSTLNIKPGANKTNVDRKEL